ncbi:ubiquitin carboxyl-terminal hydrolase 30 isoform X2 [Podarcis muralis]
MLLSRRGVEELGRKAARRLFRAGGAARYKVMKNWGVIGGIAAALAASIYVLWGPITERKKRRKGLVPGLLNLGNTCFMNSLLQGLSACPSFIKWLEGFTVQYQVSQSETSGKYLSLTLLHLLKALSCQEVTEDDFLDASCLLEVLRMYRWQISSFEEQDAHELFHVLTSSLEDEWDRQLRVVHLFDVHSLEVSTQETRGLQSNLSYRQGCSIWDFSSREKKPEILQKQICSRTRGPPPPPVLSHWKLQHPFHGRLTSNMVCKHCKHQGHPLTLDQCLHHFISTESVKDVLCDNCTKIQAKEGTGHIMENQRTTFVKQLKLGKLPQCLCIHLQRLSWSNHGMPLKRNEHVQFGEFLIMDVYKHRFPAQKPNPASSPQASPDPKADVEQAGNNKSSFMNGTCSPSFLTSPVAFPYMTAPDCSSPSYLYRLMAVVVHHGDMHSGHFVTYRRSPPTCKSMLATSNQWLWISDDVVHKTTLQEVLSSSAYLLFYERVHSRRQRQSQEHRAEE